MKIYEKFRDVSVRNMSVVDLQSWLVEEIYDLAADVGQNMTEQPQEVKHIANRILNIFTDTEKKYRGWAIGKIHNIFQLGLSGSLGKTSSKITVQLLLMWITTWEKSQKGENVTPFSYPENAGKQSKPDSYYHETAIKNISFIRWCQRYCVDVDAANVDYNDLREKFNKMGERIATRELLPGLPRYKPCGGLKIEI